MWWIILRLNVNNHAIRTAWDINIHSNVPRELEWLKSSTCLVWNVTIVPQLRTLHDQLAVMNLWLVINIALHLNSVETAGMFVWQVVPAYCRKRGSVLIEKVQMLLSKLKVGTFTRLERVFGHIIFTCTNPLKKIGQKFVTMIFFTNSFFEIFSRRPELSGVPP